MLAALAISSQGRHNVLDPRSVHPGLFNGSIGVRSQGFASRQFRDPQNPEQSVQIRDLCDQYPCDDAVVTIQSNFVALKFPVFRARRTVCGNLTHQVASSERIILLFFRSDEERPLVFSLLMSDGDSVVGDASAEYASEIVKSDVEARFVFGTVAIVDASRGAHSEQDATG